MEFTAEIVEFFIVQIIDFILKKNDIEQRLLVNRPNCAYRVVAFKRQKISRFLILIASYAPLFLKQKDVKITFMNPLILISIIV